MGALKHKKRQKSVRSARASTLRDRVEVIEDYAPHAERLAELWTRSRTGTASTSTSG